MTLQEQINNDIKEAMKAKNASKLEALRFLKSLFIHNNTSSKPTDDLSIVISHVKKLQDSLSMYESGSSYFVKLTEEIEVMKNYLPKGLEEQEVVTLIEDIKAKGAADMGAIMKELQPLIKGRFDGKRASDLVKISIG